LGLASQPKPCPFRNQTRPAGSILLHQGETPRTVWLVLEGTVLLSSFDTNGDETLCALRGPGSLIGSEAIRGAPVDYEAWTLTDASLCALGADAFDAWLGAARSPGRAIAELVLDELIRDREERIALTGSAVARVARFLVEDLRRRGGALDVEQKVLARMLGMRPETLSRALARLRDVGALAEGRRIRVLDAHRLEQLCDEEARPQRCARPE
jgi:CRP-like cAMP-binding protein